MRRLTIISPTRGEKYTVFEALNKLTERRNFEVLDLRIVRFESPYPIGGDFDGYVIFEARSLYPQMCHSLDVHVAAQIPFHCSGAGAFTWGEYGSMYDYETTQGRSFPDYYLDSHSVIITAFLDDEQDQVSFNWSHRPKGEQAKIQSYLQTVVQIAIVDQYMAAACGDDYFPIDPDKAVSRLPS